MLAEEGEKEKIMNHLSNHLDKDNYKIFNNVINKENLVSIVENLYNSEDWDIAKVTNNGNIYVVMSTIRRQKIIEKQHTKNPYIIEIINTIQKIAFEKAKESGLNINDLEVEICQLIRSDKGDFFTWHPDGMPNMPRVFSIIIAFNDDFIGGEVEFHSGYGSKPSIYHIQEGSAIGYNSLSSSMHHKVLRGVRFMGLCVLKRNEDSFKDYLEFIEKENNTKN